jgi:Zn-dependent protease with chaperone function
MNFRSCSCFAYLLCLSLQTYLNYRQYNFFKQNFEATLKDSFQTYFQHGICPLYVPSYKAISRYPECPELILKKVLMNSLKQGELVMATLKSFIFYVSPLILYSTPLYPLTLRFLIAYSHYEAVFFFILAFFQAFAASLLTFPYYIYHMASFLPDFKLLSMSMLLDTFIYFIGYPIGIAIFSLFIATIIIITFHTVWYLPIFLSIDFILITPRFVKFLKSSQKSIETLQNFVAMQDLAPLADKLGFSRNDLWVTENKQPNAASGGSFGQYYIIINSACFSFFSIEELKSNFVHELGHWYYSHENISVLLSLVSFTGLFYFFKWLWHQEFVSDEFGSSSLLLLHSSYNYLRVGELFLCAFPIYAVFDFLSVRLSQRFELQSDSLAVRFGFIEAFLSSFDKLSHLKLPIDPWVNYVYSSHPPTQTRRMNALRVCRRLKLMKKL